MKKKYLILTFLLAILMTISEDSNAQFTFDANNNAALGVTANEFTRLRLRGNFPTVSATETNFRISIDLADTKQAISGVENGYRVGLRANTFLSDANFTGTLATQYGLWIRSGIHGSSAGTVTNSYGMYVESLKSANAGTIDNLYGIFIKGTGSGATVGNYWGMYQDDNTAQNFFAGRTGIGTTTVPAGFDLAVDGKIISEEVRVLMSGDWPDYVFAPEYKRTTLNETEKFIEANHHLPGIPSAAKVAEEGIALGSMDAKLLEKIEELYLHVIDQQKEIDALKKQLDKSEK